uniref:Uncharacterized protein n=1 Tax=Arundo donax TaxID=35708 RepID=A0A0A8ZZ47_ARUDO
MLFLSFHKCQEQGVQPLVQLFAQPHTKVKPEICYGRAIILKPLLQANPTKNLPPNLLGRWALHQ